MCLARFEAAIEYGLNTPKYLFNLKSLALDLTPLLFSPLVNIHFGKIIPFLHIFLQKVNFGTGDAFIPTSENLHFNMKRP